MGTSWNALLTDPKERKVFEALSDPQWDFRTVDGLSKATALAPADVKAILDKYPDLVRRSLVRDNDGRELFTLASRPPRAQEILSQLTTFITKSFH
ncbi:MAG: hypothetical protein WB729_13480 [Candidatus Sulfotelmatobacter sp.]